MSAKRIEAVVEQWTENGACFLNTGRAVPMAVGERVVVMSADEAARLDAGRETVLLEAAILVRENKLP